MVLFGQLLSHQSVQHHHFSRKHLSEFETLATQHDLTNNVGLRNHHRNRSEERLQIIRKLGTTSISWVHCNENSTLVVGGDIGLLERKREGILE